ncbi:polysaccharide deacetylase family protein [Paenibacillus sp. SI8]|uniref:polysaccharide deacetylase family protein n=1 Tax=unclassified Paenibacillus TaxID=185978 RepID=UPI0034671318
MAKAQVRERTGRSILFFLLGLLVVSGCDSAGGYRLVNGPAESIGPGGTPAAAVAASNSSEPILGSSTQAPMPTDAAAPTAPEAVGSASVERSKANETSLIALLTRYSAVKPQKWGERLPGVGTHLQTKENVIALTFDACGGKEGSGYDEKLINYLVKEQIPATLFMNARWIDANPETFAKLAANPLFEIENHGTEHRPLSVTGRAAYGLAGTRDVSGAIEEVTGNADKIEKLTGRRPLFFRSGTAFYDDVALQIVHDLGFQAAGYNILGDAGATYNKEQVFKALTKAQSGAIVLAHMNHPEKDTAEGVMKAIPVLQKAGFRFVQLSSYPLDGSS